MKECSKCKKTLSLDDFYKHPETGDKRLGKCKSCCKRDNKTSNGKYKRVCVICTTTFFTTLTEIKRGGGNCCSRKCWYIHFNNIVKREEQSPNWIGDTVGKKGVHAWIVRKLGSPRKCSHCSTISTRFYDWANISGQYKRDIADWIRLCRACHVLFDRKERVERWRKTVKRKYGWKTKE